VVALPFTLKSIERQKKKKKLYGNVNISPCKNIIFPKKNPPKETKILQGSLLPKCLKIFKKIQRFLTNQPTVGFLFPQQFSLTETIGGGFFDDSENTHNCRWALRFPSFLLKLEPAVLWFPDVER
jgi:hypothetical protein